MLKHFIIAAQLLLLFQTSSVFARDDGNANEPVVMNDEQDYDQPLENTGTVTSIEAFSGSGEQTGSSLQLAAEYYTNNGEFEKAIKLCRRALDKSFSDLDIHKAYALAMEGKLNDEDDKNKDHDLLNQIVREWLMVYRTEVGEEKGICFHGIDPMGKLFEDEDRGILARTHIVSLTGRAPKPWETDTKFMKWVNRPMTAVSGRLISVKPDASKPAPANTTKTESTDTK